MGMLLTSPEETRCIGKGIQRTHSKGLDDIDPNLALFYLPLVVHPLGVIINCSLENGVVPDLLKEAKVILVFKKGAKHELANYRHISVLPFFAKLLEKIMYISHKYTCK